MPDSLEEYQQQTGRCGRDGMPSSAIMFVRDNDVNVHFKHIAYNKDNTFKTEAVKRVLSMRCYCKSFKCRRGIILQYFGENMVDCKKRCDNCQTENKYEITVKTREACDLVKCIQSIIAVFREPSVELCVKVYTKSCSKDVKCHNLHEIPEYGFGKNVT